MTVEVIKSVVTFWGFWIFLLGALIVCVFRKPLTGFINRTTRMGGGAFAAEAQAPQEQTQRAALPSAPLREALAVKQETPANPGATVDEILTRFGRTAYTIEIEAFLTRNLTERGLVAASHEYYRALLALAALGVAAVDFEQIYSAIWTSQIRILQAANGHLLSEEEARKHYDVAAATNRSVYDMHPFEEYMKFLTGQMLLRQPTPETYEITVKGRGFLLYMVNEGKSGVRPIF